MTTAPRRFVFGRCLGRGSFGEVYAATMRSPGGLESAVAIKLLRADIDLRGEAVRRLRDEGRLLARLNHPAILKVFDLVTLRGRIALITELVDGADLADCLPSEGGDGIAVRPLVQALAQIAGALDAAATTSGPDGPLRLVHRDLKPSNIRIDRHGQAKLLDFGIARFDASDREVRTASDLVVGSVPYMAPERFVEREVNPSSDIFSLGCTLYEGLTGDRFYGTSNVAKITGLALQPEKYRETIAERIDGLSVALGVRSLLHELVRLEATERPNAGEVAQRLEELSDAIGGPTLRMWCRQREWGTSKVLKGPLEGEVVEEGELETPPEPKGTPVIHRAPLQTIEPGQTADALMSSPGRPVAETADAAPHATPPRPPVNPTLAPPLDEDGSSAQLPRPPRSPAKDSAWERPYTTEGEQPASEPVAARISADPEPAPPSRLGAVLVVLALVVLAVAGVVVILGVGLAGLGWMAS